MNLFKKSRDKLLIDGYGKYHFYGLAFLLGFLLAALFFLPFVIKNNGYFVYYGDFNAQQIPFHIHGVDMIRNGNFGWDWFTDLGANMVGDYSFYMSTSPFFWLMCIFPSSVTPYLIIPVLCLKFGVASLCAYAYLKRFVKKPHLAVAGALMYAFCGGQICNIFFNHFHDSVAFFPLMLLGIEEYMQNDRKGLFAFSVFISASINYFFFAGQAVFCVIYFLFRASSVSFKVTPKKFFGLIFEAVLGVVMSLFLFLTSVLSIMGNYRLSKEFSSLGSALLWQTKSQLYAMRYGHILQSLFYPPDPTAYPEFFGGTDFNDTLQTHTTRWASNGVWLPLFGMTGAITYIWNRRKSWLSRFILFLVLCAVVPVLNSLFVVGNTNYYARWMYMLALMLVVATVISLDRHEFRWGAGISISAVCSFLLLIPSFIRWKIVGEDADLGTEIWSTTRSKYPLRIAWSLAVVIICLIAVHLLIRFLRGRRNFSKVVAGMVSVVVVVTAFAHVSLGVTSDSNIKHIIDYYIETDFAMKGSNSEPDSDSVIEAPLDNMYEEFYRTDGYRRDKSYGNYLDNLGIYQGLPHIQCFNSTVPASILSFYNDIVGVQRDVSSKPFNTLYGLRAFLSVKYLFVDNAGGRNGGYTGNAIKGFTKDPVSKQEAFTKDNGSVDYEFYIYENENYIPMGYTFTEFMRESEFTKIGKDNRHIYLCSYLVVPDADADEYAGFLKEVKYSDIGKADYELFEQSVKDRLAGDRCESFEWDSYGFKGVIDLAEDNYVFFSVPYDVKELAGIGLGGWSARVNGVEVEIERVYGGLMAVKAPAGEDVVIEFEYETPGRKLGLVATVFGFLVFAAYLLFFKKLKKQKASYSFFEESYYDDMGYAAGETDAGVITVIANSIKKHRSHNAEAEAEDILDDGYCIGSEATSSTDESKDTSENNES